MTSIVAPYAVHKRLRNATSSEKDSIMPKLRGPLPAVTHVQFIRES